MIHVQREQVDEHGVPIKPNANWFRLARDATDKALAEGEIHKPLKDIYAHSEVRRALGRLFREKCAYCESKISATADWEVEHFRPKGRVTERPEHPGYYWLAYDWDNLYPSCQHCNQRRKDPASWDDIVELPAGGKANHFPLLDESTRVMSPDSDIRQELRLLIDPSLDDPEAYLAYDLTGQILSLDSNPVGCKTIDVLHLSRRHLRKGRENKIKELRVILTLLSNRSIIADAHHAIDGLRSRACSDDCEYAGLARFVEKHPSRFGIRWDDKSRSPSP